PELPKSPELNRSIQGTKLWQSWQLWQFRRFSPRPGDAVVAAAREDDLEQLQRAGGEGGLRSREVEVPRAHEPIVEHRRDVGRGAQEPAAPVLERLRVVQPQVLHV